MSSAVYTPLILLESDLNDIIKMLIHIIFRVNDIFGGINLHSFTKEHVNNGYSDVLGCPWVSWGIKTDRCYNSVRSTKHETCTKLHRFHIMYISSCCTTLIIH